MAVSTALGAASWWMSFVADHADLHPPRWIADDAARARLAALALPLRDRFLVDLLCTTGIRVGEALSLFIADLHFGGGSRQLGCGLRDPHFHVRVDNPVENQARAKGGPRTLFVHRDLVESYVDYALERRECCRSAQLKIAVHMCLSTCTARTAGWGGRRPTAPSSA